jgi:ribosomal protein S18 acetylase RimI-like enzyme
MAELIIRPYTDGDAEAVERLRVAGWKAAYRGMIPDAFLDSMPVDVETRRERSGRRPAGGVESMAVQDRTVVGWVAGGPSRDDDRQGAHQGEIYACYVLPWAWRGGVGSRLMAHATEALGAAGRGDVTLWVLEANQQARRFYEACGFRPDGRRKLLDFGELVPGMRYRRPGKVPVPRPDRWAG